MKELSLNILDIVQNSVKADATLIEIIIDENIADDKLTIVVSDNGCGMSPEFLSRVRDPFTTTRTTRRVGMGIPLFELAAQQAGGSLEITSDEGVGTCVTARFQYNNIDRAPVGDMAGTMVTLVSVNPEINFIYIHSTGIDFFNFPFTYVKLTFKNNNIHVVTFTSSYKLIIKQQSFIMQTYFKHEFFYKLMLIIF